MSKQNSVLKETDHHYGEVVIMKGERFRSTQGILIVLGGHYFKDDNHQRSCLTLHPWGGVGLKT